MRTVFHLLVPYLSLYVLNTDINCYYGFVFARGEGWCALLTYQIVRFFKVKLKCSYILASVFLFFFKLLDCSDPTFATCEQTPPHGVTIEHD